MDATGDITERGTEAAQETWGWLAANAEDVAFAGVVAAAIALLLIALRALGHRLLRGGGDDASGWRVIFGHVLAKTGSFFIIMAAAKLVAAWANTPEFIHRPIDILFVIATSFQAAIWGRELVLGFIHHRVGEAEEQSTLGSAIGIIRLIVTIALFAIAIILVLSNLGVNVTGLVAGLGIGGIAIGLAAQGIFSDLFAALSIIFDRPFRKGDTITFGMTTGTVQEIGLKSTRIRSLNGEEVVISNANLLNMQVQNWALLERRRALMNFGVIYQTPPDLLARLPEEVNAIVSAQPLATFGRCHAFQFGPSSIDFELLFHVETPDMEAFMAARQAIIIGLLRRFEEMGIDFAYPTQMTFTAGLDGKPLDPRECPLPAPRGA